MPVDPDVANLLQMLEAAGIDVSTGTPEDARNALAAMMVGLRDPDSLAPVESVADIAVGSVPLRVYRPHSPKPLPTVVFFHGGGFVIGSVETHDGVCRRLCNEVDAVVVSVEYRLAPEHPFPAAVQDCRAVLSWVAAHLDDYGADPARLAVGGDSAGGNLAAVCAQQARSEGIALAAQLLVYPVTDMLGEYPSHVENGEGYFLTRADMDWFGRHYVGIDRTDPRAAEVDADPRLSPLHAESLDGLPPAVVATAEFDPLRDDGDAYAAALAAAGVKVEHQQFAGLIHGFYGVDLFGTASIEATRWINARLKELLA